MVSWNRQKIVQVFQQPLSFDILIAVPRDAKEQRLHIGLEQGRLVDQSGVEDHIRAVLEWEDVVLLPAPDGGPHANRCLRAVPAGPGVPLDPPQKAGVGGGAAVVIVYIQGGQTADIDFIFALARQRVGKLVVQTVDALNHQHVPLPQRKGIAVVLPRTLYEIECRHLHRLTIEQADHVRVELLYIHSAQALKVVLTVFIPRGVLPIFEVVIRCDCMWVQSAGAQLCGQAV